jgi:hypothetical protein
MYSTGSHLAWLSTAKSRLIKIGSVIGINEQSPARSAQHRMKTSRGNIGPAGSSWIIDPIKLEAFDFGVLRRQRGMGNSI